MSQWRGKWHFKNQLDYRTLDPSFTPPVGFPSPCPAVCLKYLNPIQITPAAKLSLLRAVHPLSRGVATLRNLAMAALEAQKLSSTEQTEVQQWITTSERLKSSPQDASILDKLNTHLTSRSTLLGTKPSKADVAIYESLAPAVKAGPPSSAPASRAARTSSDTSTSCRLGPLRARRQRRGQDQGRPGGDSLRQAAHGRQGREGASEEGEGRRRRRRCRR